MCQEAPSDSGLNRREAISLIKEAQRQAARVSRAVKQSPQKPRVLISLLHSQHTASVSGSPVPRGLLQLQPQHHPNSKSPAGGGGSEESNFRWVRRRQSSL